MLRTQEHTGGFRKNKKILIPSVIVLLLIGAGLVFYGAVRSQVNATRKLLEQERFITHAGGEITGPDGAVYRRTNSRESLQNYLENGTSPFLETDFLKTSDGKLVLGHSWDEFVINGKQPDEAVTESEFLDGKLAGSGLTPASLEDLISVMEKRPEIVVITDAKSGNIECMRLLASEYPSLRSRFIVQIYHEKQYNAVIRLGFFRMIYTLYKATDEERDPAELARFTRFRPLVGITFKVSWMKEEKMPGWFTSVKRLNVPLYVHTVNKEEKIRDCFDNGITGIYTDRLDFSGS